MAAASRTGLMRNAAVIAIPEINSKIAWRDHRRSAGQANRRTGRNDSHVAIARNVTTNSVQFAALALSIQCIG